MNHFRHRAMLGFRGAITDTEIVSGRQAGYAAAREQRVAGIPSNPERCCATGRQRADTGDPDRTNPNDRRHLLSCGIGLCFARGPGEETGSPGQFAVRGRLFRFETSRTPHAEISSRVGQVIDEEEEQSNEEVMISLDQTKQVIVVKEHNS